MYADTAYSIIAYRLFLGMGEEEPALIPGKRRKMPAIKGRQVSRDETESGMKTEAPTSEAPETKSGRQFWWLYFKKPGFQIQTVSSFREKQRGTDNLVYHRYKHSMEGADERSNAVTGLAEYQLHMRRGGVEHL